MLVSKNDSQLNDENFLFPEIVPQMPIDKKVTMSFTAPDISSVGGLMAVARADKETGFISEISKCIEEWRSPNGRLHSIEDMVRQRVMQISCGYEDADDCDALRKDHILKMCCGRSPEDGDLCSQPTMSRLENHVQHKELYDMGEAFVDNFIKSYGDKVPKKIILDVDDSNANTYGGQQLSLFNDYYGEYCYMPLFIFEGYSGKMILPILRPGRVSKRMRTFGIIRRLIERIREAWPNVSITIRGDAMFCIHEMFEWADTVKDVHYCVGLSGNRKLNRHPAVTRLTGRAEEAYRRKKIPARYFSQFFYKAETWAKGRWVIVKVECNNKGVNVRFIVTDKRPDNHRESKMIYEKMYCRRGMCELWIRELKAGLHIDRMSCNNFSANQFRVFLHAIAYVLLWNVRYRYLRGTKGAMWTIQTIQMRLIKSAVRIVNQKTQVKVEFGRSHPDKDIVQRAICGKRVA